MSERTRMLPKFKADSEVTSLHGQSRIGESAFDEKYGSRSLTISQGAIKADKELCMSQFLSWRFVVDDDIEFFNGITHQRYHQLSDEKRVAVDSANEIDVAIRVRFAELKDDKLGILLSGGMDSACLAAYMPKGAKAYTFRFLGGGYQSDELRRAEAFAVKYGLDLCYVDIDWGAVESCVDDCMRQKGAPVHSIEPQICYAARIAKNDGVTRMVIGDGADYVFGGMDGLLSKDWRFDEYVKRTTYVNPAAVLKNSRSTLPIYEKYRLHGDAIDWMRFYDEVITDESYSSYQNAFLTAGLSYVDPYEYLKRARPLDLARIRGGESKYFIRELFKMKYPELPIPEKNPMPRPVDRYFKDWRGPSRLEFRKDIDYSDFTGNQKWLIWCLERFLNLYTKG